MIVHPFPFEIDQLTAFPAHLQRPFYPPCSSFERRYLRKCLRERQMRLV